MENPTTSDQQLEQKESTKRETEAILEKKPIDSVIRCACKMSLAQTHKGKMTRGSLKNNSSKEIARRERRNYKDLLFLRRCEERQRNELRNLSNYLRFCPLSQVIEFDLQFDPENNPNLTNNKGLKYLGEALKHLPLLKNLEFYINDLYLFVDNSELSDKGLHFLSQGLKSCLLLKILRLKFYLGNRFTDKGMQYLSQAIKSFISLHTFQLSVGCQSSMSDLPDSECITDKGLRFLSRSLKLHVSLNNIQLDFAYHRKFTNEGMKDLGQALESLTSLSVVNLKFSSSSNLGDEGVKYISKALKHLLNLRELHFLFYNMSIGDDGIKSISEAITEAMRSYSSLKASIKRPFPLEEIYLYCNDCPSIGDEGLISICDLLKSLPSLSGVCLDFDRCTKITDEGGQYLYHSLENITKERELDVVSLSFADVHGIGKETHSLLDKIYC